MGMFATILADISGKLIRYSWKFY